METFRPKLSLVGLQGNLPEGVQGGQQAENDVIT